MGKQGNQHRQQHLCQVRREQEADEFLNVGVDATTLFNGTNEGIRGLAPTRIATALNTSGLTLASRLWRLVALYDESM